MKVLATVPVEVSARHVHLCRADFALLFGADASMLEDRPLSQPGYFLAKERVVVVGPRSRFERVAILGPMRAYSQVELSISDCIAIGVQAPVRDSGDIEGTPGIELCGPCGSLMLQKGLIVARRHIHLSPEKAGEWGVADGDTVDVRVESHRPLVLEKCLVRVDPSYESTMHIDTDEANAAGICGSAAGQVVPNR